MFHSTIAISLYVNIGYFSVHWTDQSGNPVVDLLIRGVGPMVLLVAFALIPPNVQRVRTVADVQQDYASKLEEARLKQQVQEIARQAERKEREARDERLRQREAVRATQLQLLRLAGEALRQEYTVLDEEGYQQIDYQGLEAALRATRRWPLTAASASVEEQAEATRAEDTPPEARAQTHVADSGALRWLDVAAVAAFLQISRQTARNWMDGDWSGPYRLVGCRNFEVRRGTRTIKVRKAPLTAVTEVKQRLDQARHSQNGVTSPAVLQLVPQAEEEE